MDHEYGDDGDLTVAAFEAAERATSQNTRPLSHPPAAANARDVTQPKPQALPARDVTQPKPQALPARASASSILVSPRQKGNPILNSIRSMPWEYSDIPADFVLGATTCALFLSLKYHRLHPEYIYSRIRQVGQKYNLRILLVMVDIETHQDPLKELSKTSLINNVTVILAWSANEAGRYLELFKSCEHSAPTAIRAQQSTTFADNLVQFITVPRSINKTDAVGLVSNFGSVRTSVNARPEDLSHIAGWGDKKVKTWCHAVREPFRVHKTSKPRLTHQENRLHQDQDSRVAARLGIGTALPTVHDPVEPNTSDNIPDADRRPSTRFADDYEPGADEEEALAEAAAFIPAPAPSKNLAQSATKRPTTDEPLSEGFMAALNKLRQQ